MAADANIFAQYLRPVRSVQDFSNDMDLAEGNKLKLAASRMDAQKAERGAADEAAVRSIVSQYGSGDKNELAKRLYGGGFITQAQGIEKSIAEEQAAALNRRKTEGDIEKQQREAADASYGAYEMARSRFLSDPAISKQKVVGALTEMAAFGKLPAKLVEQLTANLPDDPAELRADIERGDLSRLSPKERMELFAPKWGFQGTGQKQVPVQSNPRAPGFNANQPLQMEQTPDSVARSDDAAKSRAQSAAQHSQTLGLQRDRFNADQGTAVADAGGPSQAPLVKKFGKAEAGRRWKADGTLEFIPGGSQDMKAQGAVVGKDAVDNVVATLRNSYDVLDKGAGITSTEEGVLSNLGRTISKSPVGQLAGGAVGGKNQKERDAIAQARPMLLQAIMKATGMSAKQMDSNAELKLYLATATDPTLSLQANREALDRIERLFGGGMTNPNTGGASGDFGNPGKTKSGATVSNW